jgi:signal transduction histidine kinase
VNNLTEAQTLTFLPVHDHDNKTLLASCFAWHDTGIDTAVGHRDVADYHVLGNFLSHSVAQLMLQNKDSEQKKFMSNFSHELRTPINGILGSAQFLQDTVSDDYQNELLQSIVVSSNTLLDTASLSHLPSCVPVLSHMMSMNLGHVPSWANAAEIPTKR